MSRQIFSHQNQWLKQMNRSIWLSFITAAGYVMLLPNRHAIATQASRN
jgi:hypothetical protein